MASSRQLSRRSVLGAALGGVTLGGAGLLTGCSTSSSGSSSGGSPGAPKGKLNVLVMKQAGYSDAHVKEMTSTFTAANPGVTVSVDSVAYEALHDKIVAAAPAGSYDVVLVDVIWPAELASKGLIADISDRVPASWSADVLPGALASGQYQGKYYGVPWLLDTKYFYANKAQLTAAKVDPASLSTWDGVLTAARALKAAKVVEFPLLWSWSQAEALICDFAALTACFGGKLTDDKGAPAWTSGGAVQALQWMRSTIDEGLTSKASLESLEDDVRKSFVAGSTAMALNWTYMYASATDKAQSKVADDVLIQPVPGGPGGRISTNGSMALAITTGSSNKDTAWAYVQTLASRPVQEKYVGDSLPIWKASYDDAAVKKSAPAVVEAAKVQLASMVNRPEVVKYNKISAILQVELQNALLGKKDPQAALNDAATKAASA